MSITKFFGAVSSIFKQWVDWAMDQTKDFDAWDFFWLKMAAMAVGMLLGVSCSSVLKKFMPLVFVFFFFSAYKVMAPRLASLGELIVGDYDKDVQKFTDDYDAPDFI